MGSVATKRCWLASRSCDLFLRATQITGWSFIRERRAIKKESPLQNKNIPQTRFLGRHLDNGRFDYIMEVFSSLAAKDECFIFKEDLNVRINQ